MRTHAAPSHQRTREAYFALISRQLPGLYEFVRHQLAYFEAIGDLVPGELTVEDAVDAVLLLAYRAFVTNPPHRNTGRWLMTLAREHLEIPTPEEAAESLEFSGALR
jgi:hypothetical protein